MPDIKLLSDEELVVQIRTKNKERYSDLVKRYQDKLMRYATYLLHDEQKALDVVQESFIKAYVNLNGFDTKKKFGSWIYRIVHNEAMNSAKKFIKEIPLMQGMDFKSDEDIEYEFSKKEIVEKSEKLNSFPEVGRIVPETGDPNIRELLIYSYRLIYEVFPGRVEVLALIHSKRNFIKTSGYTILSPHQHLTCISEYRRSTLPRCTHYQFTLRKENTVYLIQYAIGFCDISILCCNQIECPSATCHS